MIIYLIEWIYYSYLKASAGEIREAFQAGNTLANKVRKIDYLPYPFNYGILPKTFESYSTGGDGDPLDVLVVTPYPVMPGAVIRSRPIGVLNMSDESGVDAKLLAVPHTKLSKLYDHVNEISDLPELLIKQIQHYFENYKALEPGKWVKVEEWDDAAAARKEILASRERFLSQ